VYPASNRSLARRIIENGGALVSEYECGTLPRKWHFPARNRIISGWSRGSIIVEAPEKSGALHTARFALEQGRDLWVAAAGAASNTGFGTKALVIDGCRIINGAADIVKEWSMAPQSRMVPKNRAHTLTGGAALAESLQMELGL
jgi:DNA processing protein